MAAARKWLNESTTTTTILGEERLASLLAETRHGAFLLGRETMRRDAERAVGCVSCRDLVCALLLDLEEKDVVMWCEKRMREGKCPPDKACLSCERLGRHLEPA